MIDPTIFCNRCGNWLAMCSCQTTQAVEKISPDNQQLFGNYIQRIADLERQLAERDAALARCVEAIKALLIMMDCGDSPRKLDDALTWRQNDEKARSMAIAAISGLPASAQATAKVLAAARKLGLALEEWKKMDENGEPMQQPIAGVLTRAEKDLCEAIREEKEGE